MPVATGQGHHLAPGLHVALPFRVPAGRQHGAVRKEPKRAAPARGHGCDVPPGGDIALAVAIPPSCQHGAV